jgi:hypothetical protein
MRSGPNGPFLRITSGLVVVLLGIYLMYLTGVDVEIVLITLGLWNDRMGSLP